MKEMAKENSILDLAFRPNGELNATYILSNANLLLKAGEVAAAESLFRIILRHSKYSFCAHYGIGQCQMKRGAYQDAVHSFEQAICLQRRSYIAHSLIEALLACGRREAANSFASLFASEFSHEDAVAESFLNLGVEPAQRKNLVSGNQ